LLPVLERVRDSATKGKNDKTVEVELVGK